MSSCIRICARAQADIDAAAEYIAKDSQEAGARFLAASQRALEQILATPFLGRTRQHLHPKLKGLRSWRIRGFENWLIFYRATEQEIDVIRVLHGARDLAAAGRLRHSPAWLHRAARVIGGGFLGRQESVTFGSGRRLIFRLRTVTK